MSAFIVELLESAFPTIERMAVTFQKVKSAQVAEGLVSSNRLIVLKRLLSLLLWMLSISSTCFDEVEGIVDGGGDGEGARCATRRRRRQRRLPPPPLTGGHRQ